MPLKVLDQRLSVSARACFPDARNFEETHRFRAGWVLYFLGQGFDAPDLARDLEYAAHFYGRPIPLIRKWIPQYDFEVMIFNVGGLLVLLSSGEPFFSLVNPDITLEQLATSIEQGVVPAQEIQPDVSQAALNFWFGETSYSERGENGRNRCLELYRRGGRVNAKFLK